MKIFLALLFTLSFQHLLLAADATPAATNSFKMKLVSQMTTDVLNQKMTMKGDTEVAYNWQSKGQERTLALDSVQIKVNMDGNEMMDLVSTREKLVIVQKGTTNILTAETAPNHVKKMLQHEFGTPLCRVELDRQGTEIKRQYLADKDARPQIVETMVANSLLFHPPYHPSAKEWSADKEISMGNGGFAKGKLTYTKPADGKSPYVVKVTGTLMNERFPQPGTPVTVKEARYVVTGEQTYDPALKEWVSGHHDIVVSHQLEAEGKIVGAAKGNINATFQRLPTAK